MVAFYFALMWDVGYFWQIPHIIHYKDLGLPKFLFGNDKPILF